MFCKEKAGHRLVQAVDNRQIRFLSLAGQPWRCTVHCHLTGIQEKLNAELKAHTWRTFWVRQTDFFAYKLD